MKTVYVIQNSGKNILPARDFGRLHVILTGKEERDEAIVALQKALIHFQSDDSLLLIGHPVYIGVACYIVLTLHKRVNVLVWDKQHYVYNEELICL